MELLVIATIVKSLTDLAQQQHKMEHHPRDREAPVLSSTSTLPIDHQRQHVHMPHHSMDKADPVNAATVAIPYDLLLLPKHMPRYLSQTLDFDIVTISTLLANPCGLPLS
jgi:hypothetical protein